MSDRLDLLAHWNEQPCPATAQDGRRCVLDIQHSAAHIWEPGETEVESLRRQLKGAVEERDALSVMLKRLLDVALVDGYGDQVADEAAALLARVSS